MSLDGRSRVCYYFDESIGSYYYNASHPMKPFRIRMTDSLVLGYGLYNHLQVIRPRPATFNEMTMFHTDKYVKFLQKQSRQNDFMGPLFQNELTPELSSALKNQFVLLQNTWGPDVVDAPLRDNNLAHLKSEDSNTPIGSSSYNFNEDCPFFPGIYDFSAISVGGSMQGAEKLATGDCDIAINWAGGLHHAKKTEASGFCYMNDIVLAILQLLRTYQRVLYVDVDVHHGDGVEEAFYTTDRVMTLSFHLKANGFFPGTGGVTDVGLGRGKNYAVNVPFTYGVDDSMYEWVFKSIMDQVIARFKPGAIVLQLGADSLAGDRLGHFNLSMRGHAFTVEHVKSYKIPLLMLGGGGYTIRNVARTWTYETARAVNVTPDPILPFNEFLDYYGPQYILDVPATNARNLNSRERMQRVIKTISEHLREINIAPSVYSDANSRFFTQQYLSPTYSDLRQADEDRNPDRRLLQSVEDQRLASNLEYFANDAPLIYNREEQTERQNPPQAEQLISRQTNGNAQATANGSNSTSNDAANNIQSGRVDMEIAES